MLSDGMELRQHFAGHCVSDSNAVLFLLVMVVSLCSGNIYFISLWKHSLQ
jgi:hypothetical protein